MVGTSSSFAPFEGNTQNALDLNLTLAPEEDHDIQIGQSSQGELRMLEPGWLNSFLKCTFSEPCSVHSFRRNWLNKYCIDCPASLCSYCVRLSSHKDHSILEIQQYATNNMVPLDTIEQHIECSDIQPYWDNMQQRVLALTPLPLTVLQISDNDPKCRTCYRNSVDHLNQFCYCSIYCKAEAFTKKVVYDSPPFLSLEFLVPNGSQISEENELVDHPTKRQMLESDVTRVVVNQPVESVEINVDEPKEADMKETCFDELAETANEISESEIMVCEQLLRLPNLAPNLRKRTRSRKGVPQRAPFS